MLYKLKMDKNILIIDDEPLISMHIARLLQSEDFSVLRATNGKEGLSVIENQPPDLIILDLKLPDVNGMDLLKKISEKNLDTKVVVLTGHGNIDSAVQAIKLGAADYITKPFIDNKLKAQIKSLLSSKKDSVAGSEVTRRVVGDSPPIRELWDMLSKFAPPDVNILLEGETGTGKELFAHAIHEMSRFNNGPFIPLDCAAMPETIIESEIFGYEKGAFTGAENRKPGKFEIARGGTIFLDEISNMPISTQAKLLRVVQERKVYPLGSKEVEPLDLDCRVITASNTNLVDMVNNGLFREDLYYRLSTVKLVIPPLRERRGDIKNLCKHFVELFNRKLGTNIKSISDDVFNVLENYEWPGNIRELENVIKYAVIKADDSITLNDIPNHTGSINNKDSNNTETISDLVSCITNESDNDTVDIKLKIKIMDKMDLKQVATDVSDIVKKTIISKVCKSTKLSQTELSKNLNIDPKTFRSIIKKIE